MEVEVGEGVQEKMLRESHSTQGGYGGEIT